METEEKTSIFEKIKGFSRFTKNMIIIYFQGLKEATGNRACMWNINATYFKGELPPYILDIVTYK